MNLQNCLNNPAPGGVFEAARYSGLESCTDYRPIEATGVVEREIFQ
ncbi:hypothetical protein [Nostoc sp.]